MNHSINCFKTILDHLESLRHKFPQEPEDAIHTLKSTFRFVRTFYLCVRKRGEGVERCESAVLRIENDLPKWDAEIQPLCFKLLTNDHLGAYGIDDDVKFVTGSFKRFQEEFEELYLICLDGTLSKSEPQEDELMDMINSLLENLQDLLLDGLIFYRALVINLDALKENVKFWKSLVQFATLRGLQHTQMEDLLALTQDFVLNASRLACLSWHRRYDRGMSGKISEFLLTIKPDEPRVHNIYVHVLLDAKSSQSSHTPIPASCKSMLEEFIDSLKYHVFDLLSLGASYLVPFKYQMQKLHEALVFLKTIMREQQNKFDDLSKVIHDVIGVVICEAGIVICSLFTESNEQRLVKDLDSMFSDVFNKIELIKAQAIKIYPKTLELSFPRTNMLGLVDSVLEKLKSFDPCEADSLALAKDRFLIVQEDLMALRPFLGDIKVQREQQKELQTLWNRVAGAAYQIEFILDSLMVGDALSSLLMLLNSITEEIKLVKSEALETFPRKGDVVEVQKVLETSLRYESESGARLFTDHVVGLDDDAKEIIQKLTRGTKQLDISSIVGMPGLGKTTLAKKIYQDLSICRHFHFRSWCTVSQEYNKNDLLRQILHSHVSNEEIEKNKDDLAQLLYRCLKGKTYLIILDDVWDCSAWNDLGIAFPDDRNQSRVLLTSRNANVALQIRPDNEPHALRLLNNDESWELLQKKAFDSKGCPEELCDHGKRISQKCKGLPLSIVLVAGILANTEPDAWGQVEDHLSETSVDQCRKVLELSYYHLPEYLKSCFLSLGTFREDARIPIRRLLWLWIAEGFVKISDNKHLERVAEEYMMELVQRSLVIVAENASTGRVKACTVHDLLRDFCVAKGKEEHCLNWLQSDDELHTFNEPSIVHRLYVRRTRLQFANSRLLCPHLRSLWLIAEGKASHGWENSLYILRLAKLLRVLDLSCIRVHNSFPTDIVLLAHLSYLAVRGKIYKIPASIAHLSNLETLIVENCEAEVSLPETLWNMKKLRHLYTTNLAIWTLPKENLQDTSNLENLDTLSTVVISTNKILQRFSGIRRLKCKVDNKYKGDVALDFMGQLESLTLSGSQFGRMQLNVQFPLSIKKLAVSYLNLPWSQISAIAKLPNLEVLKLLGKSFPEKIWDMEDMQFSALRFLKLEGLKELVSWTGLDDNFPCLQKLVLRDCCDLEEVPSCLGVCFNS